MIVPNLSKTEKLSNGLLTLYVIDRCNKFGRVDGSTKLQKLMLHCELTLFKAKAKALNFKYFTYKYGPFSKEFKGEKYELMGNGLITEKHGIVLTPRGKELLKDAAPLFDINRTIISKIDKEIEKRAKESKDEITASVKARKSADGRIIRTLDRNIDVIEKIRTENADTVFDLDGWESTLSTYFDEEEYNRVNKAMTSAREENSIPMSEVF